MFRHMQAFQDIFQATDNNLSHVRTDLGAIEQISH